MMREQKPMLDDCELPGYDETHLPSDETDCPDCGEALCDCCEQCYACGDHDPGCRYSNETESEET